MENKWAVQICKKLLKEGIISPEQEEIYIYGFELILSFLISTTIIFVTGLLLRQIVNTLVFLFLFILIRRCTGGFHATTYLQCKLGTIFTYLIIMCLSLKTVLPLESFAILALLGGFTILLIGPIENSNKPLSAQEKLKNKWKGFLLFEIATVTGYWSGHVQFSGCNTMFYTLALIIILMIIPKLIERRKHT